MASSGALGTIAARSLASVWYRGEHAVEANEVQPRTRHQGRETLHEFQRRHHDVGGAVPVGTLQLQHHLTGVIALEACVGLSLVA
jgi:hypothetical protein